MAHEQLKRLPFIEHIKELRWRIIVSAVALILSSILTYFLYESILFIILMPINEIFIEKQLHSDSDYLFVNTLFEGFLVRIKISIIAGIVISLPVHLFNIIRFVFPGLNRGERKTVALTIFVSFLLLVLGFFYAYYSIIPLSIQFLSNSSFIPTGVGVLLGFSRNVFFVLQLLIVFLIVFQIPILLVILMMTGILTRRMLLKASRFAIVAIFILSAIVTPPDIVSQIGIAFPMVGMFFLSILVAKIFRFGDD